MVPYIPLGPKMLPDHALVAIFVHFRSFLVPSGHFSIWLVQCMLHI
jgi:hypothetical protein